jgi:hypothetical protein
MDWVLKVGVHAHHAHNSAQQRSIPSERLLFVRASVETSALCFCMFAFLSLFTESLCSDRAGPSAWGEFDVLGCRRLSKHSAPLAAASCQWTSAHRQQA